MWPGRLWVGGGYAVPGAVSLRWWRFVRHFVLTPWRVVRACRMQEQRSLVRCSGVEWHCGSGKALAQISEMPSVSVTWIWYATHLTLNRFAELRSDS
jgi:hypothetical protein